jgi:hypothetical protein
VTVPASAATINEGSFSGGDFSNKFKSPTLIGYGYDTVTGATDGGNGQNNDIFAFSSLNPGAQSLTLTFAAPTNIGLTFSSGGSIYYSTQPFGKNKGGTLAGSFSVDFFSRTSSVYIPLASNFSGALYIGIYGWGPSISYSVSVPGNAPPAVPLPAAGLLLGGAVVGLGAFGRRRAKPAAS